MLYLRRTWAILVSYARDHRKLWFRIKLPTSSGGVGDIMFTNDALFKPVFWDETSETQCSDTAWGLLRSPTSIPACSSHRLVSQSASGQMGVPQGYSLGLFVFPPQYTLSAKIASRLLMLYWLCVRKLWESRSMYFNYQHVLFFFACSQFITRNFRQHFTASKPTMSLEKAVRFRVIIVPVFGMNSIFKPIIWSWSEGALQ